MLSLDLENEIFDRGFNFIAAIDEAGRGPLAGPVVAACVLCPRGIVINEELALVKDSKKLSGKMRETLAAEIRKKFAVGVGSCDHETIDKINILQATFLAMKKALGSLKQKPDYIIVDGNCLIPNLSIGQKAVVRGDSLVFSIAAASIIAKVERDRIMQAFHENYPVYGFNQHKGYGTKFHLEKLSEYGPCLIHRKSFAPINKMIKNKSACFEIRNSL